jgi:hypothetical protein
MRIGLPKPHSEPPSPLTRQTTLRCSASLTSMWPRVSAMRPALSRAGCGSAATREDSRYAGRFVRSPRSERSLKYCAAPIASAMATNTIATVLENVPRGSNHQAQAGIAATSSHTLGAEPCARIVTPLRYSITSRTITRQMTATSAASPIRGVPLQPERAATANTNTRPNSISTSSRRTSALALTTSDSVIVIAPRCSHSTYCPIRQFGMRCRRGKG